MRTYRKIKAFDNAPPLTNITGPVLDQADLFGLLGKIRDLEMPLVSVQ